MSIITQMHPKEWVEYKPRTEEENRLLEKFNNALRHSHSSMEVANMYEEYKYNIQRLRELHKKEEYFRQMESRAVPQPPQYRLEEYLALDEPPQKKSKAKAAWEYAYSRGKNELLLLVEDV